MPSDRDYLRFILDQLSPLGGVSSRAMMGEYILYYRGRILGGIFDDRLLVKPVAAARALLPEAPLEPPYEGAHPMLLVEDVDDREKLCALADAAYDELPLPKIKKRKNGENGREQ